MILSQEVVNELFDTHYASLIKRLVLILKDPLDAEDLAQDAYIKMTEKAAEGYEVIYPRAFMFQVAHNMAVDFLRKKNRENNWVVNSDIDHTHGDDKGNTAFEYISQPPEIKLDAERTLKGVFKSLTVLSPKCKQAFVNHKLHELSYRETASEMGISVSMVEKYMSKALHHVRSTEFESQWAA